MGLPKVGQRSETILVGDDHVTVRALTVAEVREIQGLDAAGADACAIACGADVSMEEAAEWLASVPADVAYQVMAAIFRLSGLSEGATKSG